MRTSIALLAIALASPTAALAQTNGSAGLSTFQSGYGGARQSVTTAQTGSTRDQNGNPTSDTVRTPAIVWRLEG